MGGEEDVSPVRGRFPAFARRRRQNRKTAGKKYPAGDKQQARRNHPACLLYTHKAVPPLWSALHHQLNDLLVRLRHAQSGQPAHVGDGVLHALFHDAVSAKELVAAAIHGQPQQPGGTAHI